MSTDVQELAVRIEELNAMVACVGNIDLIFLVDRHPLRPREFARSGPVRPRNENYALWLPALKEWRWNLRKRGAPGLLMLKIDNLHATVDGKEILKGISLTLNNAANDPGFTSFAAGNYVPASGSPLIGAGTGLDPQVFATGNAYAVDGGMTI